VRPINLLPPELAKERSRRRRVFVYFAAALVYLLLLVVGVFFWDARVQSAQDDVAAQEEVNRSLQREVAALAEAGALRDTYETRVALVREALDGEVDWGILLNDLSRLLPPRVWVETLTGNAVQVAEFPNVIGEISFTGIGFEFADISEWLRTLDSEDFVGITGTWVNTASETGDGGQTLVNFNSTAILTPGASTNRADTVIPEVP
jgi:Tfp pilus assembly protein PilN